MRIPFILTLCVFCTIHTFGQDRASALQLVDQGVTLTDAGKYKEALAKFNAALQVDSFNFDALYEMSYTYFAMEEYAKAVENCELNLKKNPGNERLSNVYIMYGNAVDIMGNHERALHIYSDGIRDFPDAYLLYFNKAIAEFNLNMTEDALLDFEQTVRLNPDHASSHNAIARLQDDQGNNIPALMAYMRLLELERNTERSIQDLQYMQELFGKNVEKTGKNTTTIYISANGLGDTTADGKNKPNNFHMVDLMLALSSTSIESKELKKLSEVDKFHIQLDLVIASLATQKEKNSGFYWEYYAPYFIAMKEKDFTEVYSHILFANANDKTLKKWMEEHKETVGAFISWSDSYIWPEN